MTEEAKGKGKHVGGKIQEGVGEALGDREMQRKGQMKQAEGEAKQDKSRAEREADEARERERAAKRAQ